MAAPRQGNTKARRNRDFPVIFQGFLGITYNLFLVSSERVCFAARPGIGDRVQGQGLAAFCFSCSEVSGTERGIWGHSLFAARPKGLAAKKQSVPLPSANVLQNTVKLVEAVVADDQLAGAFLRVIESHLRPQFLRHLDLEAPNIAVSARCAAFGRAWPTALHALDEPLRLTNRQTLLDDLARGIELLCCVRDRRAERAHDPSLAAGPQATASLSPTGPAAAAGC